MRSAAATILGTRGLSQQGFSPSLLPGAWRTLPKPDAPARREHPGNRSLQHIAVEKLEVVIEEADFVLAVVLEERVQDIGLRPGPASLSPVGWILERIEDVMEVDEDALYQAGQHLEKEVVNVSAIFRTIGEAVNHNVAPLRRFNNDTENPFH